MLVLQVLGDLFGLAYRRVEVALASLDLVESQGQSRFLVEVWVAVQWLLPPVAQFAGRAVSHRHEVHGLAHGGPFGGTAVYLLNLKLLVFHNFFIIVLLFFIWANVFSGRFLKIFFMQFLLEFAVVLKVV